VRVFLFGAAFAIVACSMSAKLSLLDPEVGNAIVGLTFVATLLVGALIAQVVGTHELCNGVQRLPALQNAKKTVGADGTKDWVAALGVFVAGPFVVFYFATALVKQFLRRAQSGLLGGGYLKHAKDIEAGHDHEAEKEAAKAKGSSGPMVGLTSGCCARWRGRTCCPR
jgi:hypothetical protein